MLLLFLSNSSCFGLTEKVLPDVVSIRKSGSEALVKFKLNSFKPLKTDKKTKSAIVLAIIPTEAIPVIMLIALFLLKLTA